MLGVGVDGHVADAMATGVVGVVGTKYAALAGLVAGAAAAQHRIVVVLVAVDLVPNEQIRAALLTVDGPGLVPLRSGCPKEKTRAMLPRHGPGRGVAAARRLRAGATHALDRPLMFRAGWLLGTTAALKQPRWLARTGTLAARAAPNAERFARRV